VAGRSSDRDYQDLGVRLERKKKQAKFILRITTIHASSRTLTSLAVTTYEREKKER
jgi:hypothetical protein